MLEKKKYTEFYLKTFKSEIRFHPKSRLATPGYEQPSPIEKEYNQEKFTRQSWNFKKVWTNVSPDQLIQLCDSFQQQQA